MRTHAIRVLAFLEAHSITGPAKVIVELARETKRPTADGSGLEIVIATFLRGVPENSFTRAIEAEGIPIEIIEERSAFDPAVIRRIREVIARRKPDIVWTHAVKSHFLVRIAGLPGSARWIASHHGYTTTDLKTRLYNELDRWSHRGAARVVTVCDKFARDLEARGVQPDRLRVQHNPIRAAPAVDPGSVAELRRALGLSANTRVVLSVGRLSREKGHADLIRAFARIKTSSDEPLQLVLVGSGPELANLEKLATALGIRERIAFTGQQSDVRPYYALADVFALPSHSEGSPNVLLEAIQAGVPVVATAVGGVPEIVTGEQHALLVKPADAEAMAAAITRLLHDEALRQRLAASAREVLHKHTPENYFRELKSIFEEVAT